MKSQKRHSSGLILCMAFIVFGTTFAAHAEDTPPAVPVIEVQTETLAPPPGQNRPEKEKEAAQEDQPAPENANSLVVVELFSSQACVFCPKADALLGELSDREDVLALSCHVDYFDVKTGSLSHPFCSARQIGYESTLRAGPKYTPQMVIDGRYDAVGYRRDDVMTAIQRARKTQELVIPVVQKETGRQTFTLTLPEMQMPADSSYKIYLLDFDYPHKVKVAEGGNKDKSLTYYNIVSNVGILGNWSGESKTLRFDPKMTDNTAGFAILINDQKSGYIIGAAQYRRS